MKREGRWDNQKELVKHIAQITTRILPDKEGVALRFINRDVDSTSNLSLDKIAQIMNPMLWQPGGDTAIGTYLKRKILEPLVYSKIKVNDLDRPLLVSIITDGMPEPEGKSELADAIVECGNKLEAAGYPRESMSIAVLVSPLAKNVPPGVKFMIGQIGSATSSTKFLDSLRSNSAIAPVVFVTSGKSPVQLCVPDTIPTSFTL